MARPAFEPCPRVAGHELKRGAGIRFDHRLELYRVHVQRAVRQRQRIASRRKPVGSQVQTEPANGRIQGLPRLIFRLVRPQQAVEMGTRSVRFGESAR